MLKHILRVQQINLDYARALVRDVPPERMCEQPAPGTTLNHPAWVLAHLAMSAGFVASLLGGKSAAPAEWEKLFPWGSQPAPPGTPGPSRDQLLEVLQENHRRIAAALPKLSAADWDKPFPVEQMRSLVPTLGDGIVFMLTAHEATHLGQLSAWRRAMGYPSVM